MVDNVETDLQRTLDFVDVTGLDVDVVPSEFRISADAEEIDLE